MYDHGTAPRKTTSSVVSIPPQLEIESQAPAGYVTPPPPVLSHQVTSTEALQMLESQEITSDTELLSVADTLISLGAQHTAVAYPHPTVVSHPLHRHNPHCSTRLCTMARYKCIDWLIDWLIECFYAIYGSGCVSDLWHRTHWGHWWCNCKRTYTVRWTTATGTANIVLKRLQSVQKSEYRGSFSIRTQEEQFSETIITILCSFQWLLQLMWQRIVSKSTSCSLYHELCI